jgi:2'-5' RNA ligase
VRAFVALIPPASALAELATALAPVQEAHPGLRWTPAGQWHLTLAFLGEIDGDGLDDGVLPALTERLARAARRHPPMELALGGGGRFGDRVLWTRVHLVATAADSRESCAPVHELSDAAPRPCVPGHESRDHAHGSAEPRVRGTARSGKAASGSPCDRGGRDALRALAGSVGAAARRCGIAVDDRPYRAHLTLARARPGTDLRPAVEALRDFSGRPWIADALHLVRSRLGAGPGGTAAHEVLATWPLGRPPASPDPATDAPAAT